MYLEATMNFNEFFKLMTYGSMPHASKILFVSWHRGAINVYFIIPYILLMLYLMFKK
jgi:hypothetical protein